MDSLIQYDDIPTNERFYKKYIDNGKFTIKDKKKQCNFPDIVLESGQATDLVNWLNTYVYSTHHYMIDLIDGSSNDMKIVKFLKKKLPYDCEIESDDLFLKIQYPDIDEYDSKYNIIYLTWKIYQENYVNWRMVMIKSSPIKYEVIVWHLFHQIGLLV